MSIQIFQVDAFTDRAFGGNPACVCFMYDKVDDNWLQSVAEEMNLSETAFVWSREDQFQLRWFTPVAEVKLCGHATLATANVLWETERLKPNEDAVFQTLSGQLRACKYGNEITLDFPSKELVSVDAPDGLVEALGINPIDLVSDGTDYMVVVEDEKCITDIAPDFHQLAQVEARGIIVTSISSSPDFDFVSRFFAPAFGINEDPVTGSAHCLLAPYWSQKLQTKNLRAFQASKRGGNLQIRLEGDRVFLSGRAKTVFTGTLLV